MWWCFFRRLELIRSIIILLFLIFRVFSTIWQCQWGIQYPILIADNLLWTHPSLLVLSIYTARHIVHLTQSTLQPNKNNPANYNGYHTFLFSLWRNVQTYHRGEYGGREMLFCGERTTKDHVFHTHQIDTTMVSWTKGGVILTQMAYNRHQWKCFDHR